MKTFSWCFVSHLFCLLFLDMCNQCQEKKLVFPCLEAFRLGIDLPSVHMVFYEYFLKSCVGDAEWKETCLVMQDSLESRTKPMSNRPLEAFSMIVLVNNYMVWLLAAKKNFGDELVTDYDDEQTRGNRKYFTEDMLREVEVDLIDLPEGDEYEFDLEEEAKLLVGPTEERYAALREQRLDALKKVREQASENEQYKDLLVELEKHKHDMAQQEEAIRNEDTDSETSPMIVPEKSVEERRREQREANRRLKVFTNHESDNSYKRWSRDTPTIQIQMVKKLKQKDLKYQQFWAAYRMNYRVRNERTPRKRKALQDEPEFDEMELYGENTIIKIVKI